VFGGALLAQAAQLAAAELASGADDSAFMRAKIQTAAFYVTHWLPQAEALARVVLGGSGSVTQAESELL
jgi:acyl-CoA dehydrogenase